MADLKYIFQSLRVGKMEVQNRIVLPGMSAGRDIDEEGCVTPQMVAYYVERAKSRPGMMVVGASLVTPIGYNGGSYLVLFDDKCIDSVKKLVDAVHKYDTKLGVQLWQGGNQGEGLLTPSGVPSLASSSTATDVNAGTQEMNAREINQVAIDFGNAAERCLKAGFDFVEIHAAHGYLINEFLSPYFNKRTDEYGGSFENRTRFLLEAVRQVKSKVGDKITIGVKINGNDFLEKGEGWTLDEACRLAPLLEKEGVDYIAVSAGIPGSAHLTIPPMYEKQGCYVDLCQEIKKHVSIPVMTVGRIKNPVMANNIIKEGKADLVIMGRAQIADPQMVEKARNGQIADIRPCLADCRGCIEESIRSEARGDRFSVSCVVNPRVGRELACSEIEGEKKNNPKRILVVGAGCSGLEAARRAAFAGHKITIYDSRGWIGGQLKLASMMPVRQEIGDIIPWYERQLNQLGVEIHLNTTVDSELLDQMKPDAVVIATGSLPEVPLGYIEGLENIQNLEVIMVDDLLENKLVTGDNILVIGGDQIGLQVADFLSVDGKKVYVVEAEGHFAGKLAANDRWYLVGRIIEKGIKRTKNVSKIEILPGDEVWIVTDKGKEKLPEIDTIVLASKRRSNRFLAEVCKKKGIETHIIGDAISVSGEDGGTLFSCIASGYDVGRQI